MKTKRYELKRDLPTFKAGDIFYLSGMGNLFHESEGVVAYSWSTIDKFPNILTDWFEEIKPAEPLIKDEKIRKAVRAWAEANKLNELYIASNGYEIYGGIDDTVMQFVGEPLPHDDKDKTYTIEELCGEEE